MNAWSRALLSLLFAGVAGFVGSPAHSAEVAPPAGAAPSGGDVIDSSSLSHQAGEWAEFARTAGNKTDFADTFRMSFIPDPDGKGPWTELWLGKTGDAAMRFRKAGNAIDVLMKMGGAIYRIDDPVVGEKLACAGGSCASKDGKAKDKTLVGQEVVHTPAGTFKCSKVRIRSSQGESVIWTSLDIPALHLARVTTPLGFGYELVAFGKNATSAFPAHFVANPLPLQHMAAVEALTPNLGRVQPPCDPKKASCPQLDGGVAAGAPDSGLPPLRVYQPPRDAGER